MRLIQVDTRHFSFQALGRDRKHAVALLRAAWAVHCSEYTDADPTLIRELLRDVSVTPIEVGSMFRDWQPLKEQR